MENEGEDIKWNTEGIAGDDFHKWIPNPFGKPPKYTPEEMWAKAVEYFTWVQEHPLLAAKWEKGQLLAEPRMRAMTEASFCMFAGMSMEVFRRYKIGKVGKLKPQYQVVANLIADRIRSQKFEGASADLLNANIISRDLGLADKKQIEGRINLTDEPIEFD